MSDEIVFEGPVAYMSESKSAVFFSAANTSAGTYPGKAGGKGTALPVVKLQNILNVAYWGEDNRFPQNIEQQMAYCGIGKSALDWKTRALYGNGIIPGRVVDLADEGKTEVFEPIKPGSKEGKIVNRTIDSSQMMRFFLEYLQDWCWFSNCFPEIIFSKDAKSITGFVHQESCDSRFQQMNKQAEIKKVYLSKLWGANGDQYAKFDPKKRVRGLVESRTEPTEIDNEFVKSLDCIDMYNALESTTDIAQNLRNRRGLGKFKSAILPVNYPSVNKTYYQVPYWDGARLSGWVEIASKVPSIIKTMYNNAFQIKYLIQIPETYFEKLYTKEKWNGLKGTEKTKIRKELLQKMDEFLRGTENAYKSFLNVFDWDPVTKSEYGLIKIEQIENKSTIEGDLLTGSAAELQILGAMQVHPTLFGAGAMASGAQRTGGSDQREAFLIYNSGLNLERKVLLEPLNLMRDFNREVGGMEEWAEDITFRFRDTVLTTLDKGKGTEKTVS
jgi:hypothetical protein